MFAISRVALVGLLTTACSFNSDGTMKTTSATLGSQDEGGSGEPASSGAADDDDADDDANDSASSTSPPPPPPATGGPVDGSSDDASAESSGPMIDPTTDSGDPPSPNPYGDCDLGCPVAGSMCSWGGCSQPCGVSEECPSPTSGNALPECPYPNYSYCVLDCENGEICPDGMTCIGHRYGWTCGYP